MVEKCSSHKNRATEHQYCQYQYQLHVACHIYLLQNPAMHVIHLVFLLLSKLMSSVDVSWQLNRSDP